MVPRSLCSPKDAYFKTVQDFQLLKGMKQKAESWTEHAKAYIQKALEVNQIGAIDIIARLEITVEECGLSLYFLCTTEAGKEYKILYDRR